MQSVILYTKSIAGQTDSEILNGILEYEQITPVYQPIVSLIDGQTFGYEALSRISEYKLDMDIERIFRTADRMNKSWELETLCRRKTLENAVNMDLGKKLFINVNPNIINDTEFRDGFTKDKLEEYGLDFHNVIFEITERVAIMDSAAFLGSIDHYKSQNYGIAIDDVGAGYSGLNIISDVKPDLIKLDINLVRDIDKDEIKQLLCKAMVGFGKGAGIQVIAEGIETAEELTTLIKLNVDFGQGYFLSIPYKTFENITPDKMELIKKHNTKKYIEKTIKSVYPIIGHLAKQGYCFSPDEKTEDIYEKMRLHPTIMEFTVVENDVACGLLTRVALNEILGGRYGFDLYAKKPVREIIKTDFSRFNYDMPVDQVSRLAMQRSYSQLYNSIVVEQDGKYSGIVTVKDLLNACTKVDIDIAMHSNPLTGLPGNLLIEKEIMSRIFGDYPYCIIYIDVDNFKAYNDAYGFQNGDKMLGLICEILKTNAVKNEFIGHIGGDDFIVICDYQEGEYFCKAIIDELSAKINSLYRDEDVKNGFIVSKNRHSVTEKFPIASLSIAGISNKTNSYQSKDSFSNDIAQLKKKCKRQKGNYFEII